MLSGGFTDIETYATIAQTVSTNYSAVATGTTVIPVDDTIPQITEGTEFMTQTITPRNANNRLHIEVILMGAHTNTAEWLQIALFQDSTANALAANSMLQTTATGTGCIMLRHDMAAGTTSATTFRVRAGGGGAGTFTFNGSNGSRRYGGITISNIKVTEILVS